MVKLCFSILLFFCFASQSYAAIPSLTPEEIKKQCYSLEGELVKVRFVDADFVKQIAEGYYSVNIYGKNGENFYVTFPKDGLKWFEHIQKKSSAKRSFYAIVQIGTITNGYGASTEGPFLIAKGRRFTKKVDGKVIYSW